MEKFKFCVMRQLKGICGYSLVSKADPDFIICRLSTKDGRQSRVAQKWTELHGEVWDFFKAQELPDAVAYVELRLFFQMNFGGRGVYEGDLGPDVGGVPKVDE